MMDSFPVMSSPAGLPFQYMNCTEYFVFSDRLIEKLKITGWLKRGIQERFLAVLICFDIQFLKMLEQIL